MNFNHAKALPLFGSYAVIFKDLDGKQSTGRPKSDEPKEALTAEQKQEFKRYKSRCKRDRLRRQKEAEKLSVDNDYEVIEKIVKVNNASLRHLTTFINVIEYAQAHCKPVAVGELKKRIGDDAKAVSEWRNVRNWLGKNSPEYCAVTIGKSVKGWWSIRWLVVAEKEEDIFKLAAPFHLYLLNRRGWKTKAVSMEADTEALKQHYLLRFGDFQETFKLYVSEMFDVYRSALAMPNSRRTFRTDGVHKIWCERSKKVNDFACFVVNGNNKNNCSPSSVALCEVEMKGNIVLEAHWVGAKEEDDLDFEEGFFNNK